MIKKLLLAIMIALPAMGFAQKFGVINTESLIEGLPEMTEVKSQLDTSTKKYEEEFKNLQTEMEKKYGEFQKMDENTPQTIKDRRVQEIQELDQKIQQFRQTATQDLQRQQAQLMQPIQEKVMNAIKSVGTENGFTMIFPEGVPAFVSTDVQDVTALVKAKLGVKE